jgi:hypothetical protein
LRFPKLKVNPSPFELLKQNSIDWIVQKEREFISHSSES